jgi:hypothetical protein
VVYVNWDGFAWDYYEEALRKGRSLPGLARLHREGTVFAQACSGLPSLTVPMQTSLVTGAWPAVHHNTYRYLDRQSGEVREAGRRNDAETLAEACRRQGRRVAAVNQFTLDGRGTARDDPASPYVDGGKGCHRRFTLARQLARQEPDLLCLYCDELDAAGHNFGGHRRPWPTAGGEPGRQARVWRNLRRLDRELASWMRELSPCGPPAGLVLALATDHGMAPYSGRSCLPEVVASLTGLGLEVQICNLGDTVSQRQGVVVVTLGLQLQLYFLGELAERANQERWARRIVRSLWGEPYFGGALTRTELGLGGASPEFADLLIWPQPPFHFKTDPRPYAARGQHDTPDPAARHVFLGLWGEGIQPGLRSERLARVIDLAPTLAYLLGIQPPANSTGRVLSEAFVSPGDPRNAD